VRALYRIPGERPGKPVPRRPGHGSMPATAGGIGRFGNQASAKRRAHAFRMRLMPSAFVPGAG